MKISRDLNFQIKKGIHETKHFHPELEFFFVIEGNAQVMIRDSVYILNKEDFILINSGIFHKILMAPDNLSGVIRYPCELVSEFIENQNCLFLCNSTLKKDTVYYEILSIIHELVYLQVYPSAKTACYTSSLLLRLLDYLLSHYLIDSPTNTFTDTSDDLRMNQILTYVNQNFRENISLSDIAERMFVATSTLSRLFKKQSGIYFADYLNQLRVHAAVSDLLYTEKSITHIALDNGFSNPSAFYRVFTNLYHCSPSDFRKEQQQNIQQEGSEEKKNKELLIEELKSLGFANPTFHPTHTEQSLIDMSKGKPYKKNWNLTLNIGSVYNLTLANLQYHVLYLVQTLGFRYVRMWNLFSTKLKITDGIQTNNYNYDSIDGVLDFLVNNHIYPYIDFGKRPNTALFTENQTIWYDDENILFHSKYLWESAVHDFLQHIIKRYGSEEVSHWIFELTSDQIHPEASASYIDSDYQYYHAFEYLYHTAKSLVPSLLIGGPSSIPFLLDDFLHDFLKKCRMKQCIPDFISIILFPYETRNENGKPSYHRAFDQNFEFNAILKVKQILKKEKMEHCKLYVTEWNNSLSNRNFLNDSPFRAAYIVRNLSYIGDNADMIGFWMASDWISSYYDTKCIVNGGSGLLTKDSIRKPAYFAFAFMNKLGDTLLQTGEHYIATSNGPHSYYILCHNYKTYASNYYMMDENMDSPEILDEIFQDNLPIELNLTLEQMPNQTRYIIKRRCITLQEGNILNEWRKFQYNEELSHSDVKYFRESCLPGMRMEKQTTKMGKLHIQLTLQPHEISLLHIYEDV